MYENHQQYKLLHMSLMHMNGKALRNRELIFYLPKILAHLQTKVNLNWEILSLRNRDLQRTADSMLKNALWAVGGCLISFVLLKVKHLFIFIAEISSEGVFIHSLHFAALSKQRYLSQHSSSCGYSLRFWIQFQCTQSIEPLGKMFIWRGCLHMI